MYIMSFPIVLAGTTLQDQNKALGERIEKADATISKANDEIESLKSELARLKGEDAMRRRKTYGKNGEKC